MTIVWSRAALLDIDEIGDFLAAIDPVVERRTLARIQARATALAIYSGLGRPGRVLGTRELVVSGTSFVLVYRERRGGVEIANILHGARRWPQTP